MVHSPAFAISIWTENGCRHKKAVAMLYKILILWFKPLLECYKRPQAIKEAIDLMVLSDYQFKSYLGLWAVAWDLTSWIKQLTSQFENSVFQLGRHSIREAVNNPKIFDRQEIGKANKNQALLMLQGEF